MKPFVVIAYVRSDMQEILYPDITRRLQNGYSAQTPAGNGYVQGDGTRGLNPIYFADTEAQAQRMASGLAMRWPHYNFLISRVTALVDMPQPDPRAVPEIKHLSEKGLLP